MGWSAIINRPNFVWTAKTQQAVSVLSNETVAAATALHASIFDSSKESYVDFLAYIEQLVLPCTSIAEFGCGNGANLYYFAKQHGMAVVGCDISVDLIGLAKSVINNGTFNVGNQFNVNDDSVDYCISNSVFQYFPTDEYADLVVSEMLRISKKGILVTDIKSSETETDFKEKQAKRQGLTIAELELKYKLKSNDMIDI